MPLFASCSCLASGFGSGALADRIELDLASPPPTTNSTSPSSTLISLALIKAEVTRTLDATRIRLVEGRPFPCEGGSPACWQQDGQAGRRACRTEDSPVAPPGLTRRRPVRHVQVDVGLQIGGRATSWRLIGANCRPAADRSLCPLDQRVLWTLPCAGAQRQGRSTFSHSSASEIVDWARCAI